MTGLTATTRRRAGAVLIWVAVSVAVAVPIAAAASSPLLAWREPVYIAAGLAGVISLALLLFQPLLVGGYLPGLNGFRGRGLHRWVGGALVAAVVIHVVALWITSPPDVIDVLLFRSPTAFSAWGAIAMWAVFIAAGLAVLRRRLRLQAWRLAHSSLALVTIVCTVVHAVLIEGTMEPVSKALLCLLVVVATGKVMIDRRVWALRPRG